MFNNFDVNTESNEKSNLEFGKCVETANTNNNSKIL